MWVMLNDAMFSIVENREDKTQVVVRARRGGDLEKVFTSYKDKVIESDDSDYRFRIFADRNYVAEKMSEQVGRIDYDNFKNSVSDKLLKKAYNKCWSALYEVQQELYPQSGLW